MTERKRRWRIIAQALVLVLCLTHEVFADVSGIYELKENGESRRLEITEMKGLNRLQFNLSVRTSQGGGNMFGMADLKGNTATFKTSGCQLTITFAGNKAVIDKANANCRDYLMPGVLLDGIYIKK